MSENTKIEWAHHTVNFWWGCSFATYQDGTTREECWNCYAKRLSGLFSRGKATWGARGNRWIRDDAAHRELLKLDAKAKARGVRERVFINSMSDTFEDRDDLSGARELLWDACSSVTHLDILLLTKRPGNVRAMVPLQWLESWPRHVWLGTTAGTQRAADENVEALLATPAAIHFLSIEPLLEPVTLKPEWLEMELQAFGGGGVKCFPRVDWVIVGGESGGKARPMHAKWARALRDQCAVHGVAFFFKQWGEWAPGEEDVPHRPGKKAAGRLLDGFLLSGFPQ